MKRLFFKDGFVFLPKLVDQELLSRFDSIMRPKVSRVLDAVEEKELGIGSINGYREVVQRSPKRFDIRFEEQDFESIWGAGGSVSDAVPWIKIVREVLGEECRPSFSGVVFSRPGAPAQQWHIDSPHESESFNPPHALNVFVALEDISEKAGPPEVAVGSHVITNHLSNEHLNSKHLLYQTSLEIIPSYLTKAGEIPKTRKSSMSAGDCLIFDDRILHRGLANHSGSDRWMAYFSYMRPRPNLSRVCDTHFESNTSVFD